MRRRIHPIFIIPLFCFLFSCKNDPIILTCRINEIHDSIYDTWYTLGVAYDVLGRVTQYGDATVEYYDSYFIIYPWGPDVNTFFRYHTGGNGRILSSTFFSCCGPGGEHSFDSLAYQYEDEKIVHAKEYLSESATEPEFTAEYYYDENNISVDTQFNYSTGEINSVTQRTYYDEFSDLNQFSQYQFLQSYLYYYYPFRPDHLIKSIHKTYFEDGDTSEYDLDFTYSIDADQLVIKFFIHSYSDDNPLPPFENYQFYTYDWNCM